MIAATFMSLLFTPVFYVVMQRLSGMGKKTPKNEAAVQKVSADTKEPIQEKSS